LRVWTAAGEDRLMTERPVELVALACQSIAYRSILSPLQDCAADQARVVAPLHRGGRHSGAVRLAAPVLGDRTRRLRVGSLGDVSAAELRDAVGRLGHVERAVKCEGADGADVGQVAARLWVAPRRRKSDRNRDQCWPTSRSTSVRREPPGTSDGVASPGGRFQIALLGPLDRRDLLGLSRSRRGGDPRRSRAPSPAGGAPAQFAGVRLEPVLTVSRRAAGAVVRGCERPGWTSAEDRSGAVRVGAARPVARRDRGRSARR